MSLYYVQKLMYELNRDPNIRKQYEEDFEDFLKLYKLTEEEKDAIRKPDIGELYIMGVNGQILMHYAALRGYEWDEYIEAMREGLRKHGNVKAGLYVSVDQGEGGAVWVWCLQASAAMVPA